ncbi:hypothetical protein EW146_g56 [Bondarzewia mesenterica]|uniref:Uncharacterized protein n=1 Tax=Bondarzewia mesenterica TaxID=1095465 RepID=A0A4S4M880_9AGAM|nr:hypothetical protein EW146_g56 [Bondarzewia mesenterica]
MAVARARGEVWVNNPDVRLELDSIAKAYKYLTEQDRRCERVWLGVFRETVIEAPAWPFEAPPPSSLASSTEGHTFEGENVVTVQYVEEPLLYEAMTALSMNQSIAELEITSWSHHLYELPSF